MKTIKLEPGELPPGNFTGVIIWGGKDKEWYKNGVFHRDDGPAVEWANGYKEWFINGKLHREDGPALIFPHGDEYWYKEGKQHRIDGPAMVRGDKTGHYWIIDSHIYYPHVLKRFFESCVYLGKEKGIYGLEWLKFMTDQGIKEFPIIPGMENDDMFKPMFKKLSLNI